VFSETEENGADFQFISISKKIPEGCNVETVSESHSVVQRCQIMGIETKLSRDYGCI
jgi:hypothetical protein